IWVDDHFACAPDLAIGPRGEAVISSNVVPTLWSVDPVSFLASKHVLAVEDETGRDIGFTALAYSAQQGAFLAVSGSHGFMWRVDAQLQRAQRIPLSALLPGGCGLDIAPRPRDLRGGRLASLSVPAGEGDWAIRLAPDQRSGYATPGQCMG